MNVWLVMLAAGLLTFGTRVSFFLLMERMRPPEWFLRALRFVPVAVLSAIILPELATRNGTLAFNLDNPQLFAGALAALVAWRTRNVLVTLLAGMAALLILQALMK